MQGVTTAIVAFIFAGVIWQHLIKHRAQFFSALLVVCAIILLDSIGWMFPSTARPIYAVNGLLQVGAIALCVLSTGMSAKDLSREVFHTIDVVRRGGEKETIIVPLTGERPKPRGGGDVPPARVDLDRDIAAEEAALDAQEAPKPAALTPTPARPATTDTSIPLE